MLRKGLDLLYAGSGVFAAMMMVGIGVVVLVQVIARLVGIPFDGIELSAYLLAGATFMGLAYTWRSGKHLRITLLLRMYPHPVQHFLDRLACTVAAGLSLFFTYYTTVFAFESFSFGYMSRGILAVPLWGPQAVLALGVVIFTTAILDDLASLLSGRRARFETHDDNLVAE